MIETGVGAGAAAKSAAGHATAMTIYGTVGIGLVVVILATVVVFMSRMPRSPKEWAIGLISTVVSGLCLGSAVVIKFGLLDWARVSDPFESWVGMIAIGGVIFSCGMMGWAIQRWGSNWIKAREGHQIDSVIRDARNIIKPSNDKENHHDQL